MTAPSPEPGVVMADALASAAITAADDQDGTGSQPETSSGSAVGNEGALLPSQTAEAEKPSQGAVATLPPQGNHDGSDPVMAGGGGHGAAGDPPTAVIPAHETPTAITGTAYEGYTGSAPFPEPTKSQTMKLRALRERIQKKGKLDQEPASLRVKSFLKGFTDKERFTDGEAVNEPAIDLLTGIVRLLEMDETESQSLLKDPLYFGKHCRDGYKQLMEFLKRSNYSHELREAAWRAAAHRYPCGGGRDLIEFLDGESDPAGRVRRIMEGV